jgi:hypothetical protein
MPVRTRDSRILLTLLALLINPAQEARAKSQKPRAKRSK